MRALSLSRPLFVSPRVALNRLPFFGLFVGIQQRPQDFRTASLHVGPDGDLSTHVTPRRRVYDDDGH